MAYGGRAFVPLEESAEYNELQTPGEPEQEEWRLAQLALLARRYKFHMHASDSETLVEAYGNDRSTCSRSFLRPPEDYVCALCGKDNHHYDRSCFLLQESAKSGKPLEEHVLPFGANKYTQHTAMTEKDGRLLERQAGAH